MAYCAYLLYDGSSEFPWHCMALQLYNLEAQTFYIRQDFVFIVQSLGDRWGSVVIVDIILFSCEYIYA